MNSKSLLGLLTLTGILSCTKKAAEPAADEGFDFFKSSESKEACVSANLSNWEFSGPFLHNFLRCAAKKTSDGDSSMPAMQNLLNTLDPSKMQVLIDFLKTENAEATTHEERFPYLLAMTTVADRGLFSSERDGLNLYQERIDELQPFLLGFDSSRAKKVLSTWTRNGQLKTILNEVGVFIDSLQNDSLEGWSHELLAGATFRDDVLPLTRTLLQKDDILRLLEKSMEAQPAQELPTSQRALVREDFREPLSPDDRVPAAQIPPSAAAVSTPVNKLVELHQEWSKDELNAFTDVTLDAWQSYRKLSNDERQSLSTRLVPAAEALLDQQTAPLRWAFTIGADSLDLKTVDLVKVNKAMDELLLDGGNIALEAIRAKAGSSRLLENLRDLLVRGQPVPGCGNLKAEINPENFGSIARELGRLSRPQTACAGQVPLLMAIQHFTRMTIQKECDEANTACIPEKEAQAAMAHWSDEYQEPSAQLIRDLVARSLDESLLRLQSDPYYLYDMGLAKASVDVKTYKALVTVIKEAKAGTLQDLAALDQQLNESTDYRAWLLPDFLETLLADKVERLSGLSYQFNDLISGSEAHSARIFAGVYPDGPVESVLRKKLADPNLLNSLPFAEDAGDLKTYLQSHPMAWNSLLYRAKFAEGIFRSMEFGTLSGEDKTVFGGFGSSLRNYLTFDANLVKSVQINTTNPGFRARIQQPLQTIRLFGDDDVGVSSFGLWRQHYLNGPTNAKDVPAALSGKLNSWLESSFVPSLSSDASWPELISESDPNVRAIDAEFFDVEQYTPAEARLIAFYYLRNFRKHTPELPSASITQGKTSSPKADLAAFADPIRGFMNGSYLLREDAKSEFRVFSKYFPASFQAAQLETLSSFKERVLPDYATTTAGITQWSFAEQAQVTDPAKLPFDNQSPFALLSTLNLLTYSKPQTRFLPQSVVGFGSKLCRSKVKTGTVFVENPAECPLEFTGNSEEEAYGKFRDYVSSEALQLPCAFVAGDLFGSSETWQARLGIRADRKELCKVGTQVVPQDLIVPVWMGRAVLGDIFAMGKNARMKQGLAQIPSALRFYKLKQKNQGSSLDLVENWLMQSKGIWDPRATAIQMHRERFAGAFFQGQTSLLSSYTTAASQVVDTYAWRMMLIAYSETDDQGQKLDLLRDLIRLFRAEQSRLQAEGGDFHLFALTFLRKLAAMPEHLRFVSHLLGSMETLETWDFMSTELPLATDLLFPKEGENMNPFDWKDPGLNFTRFAAQTASLRSYARATRYVKDSEIRRLITQIDESLQKLPGGLEEQARFVKKWQTQIDIFGNLWLADAQSSLVGIWEQMLQTWRQQSFGSAFATHWVSFVGQLDKNLLNWDEETVLTGDESLASLLRSAMIQGPQLLKTLQDSGTMLEDLFWIKGLESALKTIEEQPRGSLAMASFLGDARFDLRSGDLWTRILRPGVEQDRAVAAIEALDSVPETLWRAALVEGTDLMGRMSKALNYLSDRLVWKVDPDHNAYRIALEQIRQLSLDEVLRNKQAEVLKLWLKADEESPDAVVER